MRRSTVLSLPLHLVFLASPYLRVVIQSAVIMSVNVLSALKLSVANSSIKLNVVNLNGTMLGVVAPVR